MKVYIVLENTVDRDGWSIGERVDKVFPTREKAEAYINNNNKKSVPDYYCHKTLYRISEYDVYEDIIEKITEFESDKRIEELEAQIEKLKLLLNEIYSEYGFSELVKIRNDLPLEIQEVIKETKGND